MMAIPRAIWGVLGLVILVLAALGWLHLHDVRVRETATAHVTIRAKDDTIHTLRGAVVALGRSLRAVDSVWAQTRGTVVRVAYTPQAVRDSMAVLTRAAQSAQERGDSAVPIGTAVAMGGAIRACRAQVDTIAGAVWTMERDCNRRVAVRDSIIEAQKNVERLMADQMAQLRVLPAVSSPRVVPFVAANRSLGRSAWEAEGGVTVRLLAGLHARALVRAGDMGRDSVGVRDAVPVLVKRRWDAIVGGMYEFH